MKILIPGHPIAASRPRVTKNGTYNPKQQEQMQTSYIIKQQYNKQPLTTPLEVSMFFFMKIPSRTPIKKKTLLKGKPHRKKPDLDNLVKFILDSSNGVLFKDDSQVYEIVAQKTYSEKPRTEIIIEEYSE